jgi:hypothetical protein
LWLWRKHFWHLEQEQNSLMFLEGNRQLLRHQTFVHTESMLEHGPERAKLL